MPQLIDVNLELGELTNALVEADNRVETLFGRQGSKQRIIPGSAGS